MHRLVLGSALALSGLSNIASAQEITLFGETRMGLGYNIDNDGGALPPESDGHDKIRAVSRVRFGVLMTGETNSGITFGGSIRGDNAIGGDGGEDGKEGQTEGDVFVSGAWGTLTMGDTNGADEQNVGDLNEVGLTCLGCENETPFISNGGGYGNDQLNFADNPFARPTVRYDYEFQNVGVSLSTNRDLTDVGAGANWTGSFGGATVTVGGGYYRFDSFIDLSGSEPVPVSAGEQWSAAIGGEYGAFNAKAIYTTASTEKDSSFSTLGAGLGGEFGPWALNFYYNDIIEASGSVADTEGQDSVGFGVNYDLGGGALAQFGVADTYADETVSDFGISMTF